MEPYVKREKIKKSEIAGIVLLFKKYFNHLIDKTKSYQVCLNYFKSNGIETVTDFELSEIRKLDKNNKYLSDIIHLMKRRWKDLESSKTFSNFIEYLKEELQKYE